MTPRPTKTQCWAYGWRHDHIRSGLWSPEAGKVWTPGQRRPHWQPWDSVALHDLDLDTFWGVAVIAGAPELDSRQDQYNTQLNFYNVSFPGVPITRFGFKVTQGARKRIDERLFRQIREALEDEPPNRRN